MDQLEDMFAGWPRHILEAALANGGDVATAIDLLLAGDAPDPLNFLPPFLEPPPQRRSNNYQELSPASSADSLQHLRLSDGEGDKDDSDSDNDDDSDDSYDSDVEGPRHGRPRKMGRSHRRLRRGRGNTQERENTQESREAGAENLELEFESEAVASILTIFPDACPEHTRQVVKRNLRSQAGNVVAYLANLFAEEGYIRAERVGQKRKRAVDDEGKKELSYDSPNRPPVTSQEYKKAAQKLLEREFPLVPSKFVTSLLHEHSFFLSPTYMTLSTKERHYDSVSYRRLRNPRKILSNDQLKWGVSCWADILDELEFARAKARKSQMYAQQQTDAQYAAELNEREHLENGMQYECGCCYDEVPFDQITHCDEIHFFCVECARRNAENEIGNGRYKLLCMDSSGCRAEFPRQEILRFLDDKTLNALAKLQQEEVLRVADIEGLVHCPFCDYAAICDPIEVDKEFRCQNPACEEVSCRHCQKKSHIPLTCEENAKDDKISQRHLVEEAMTEAMVRKCKKCGNPYIKESGCNKIWCSKCHTLQCYVCSKVITGYDHFDDANRGGKRGNCPLFDDTESRHEGEIQAAAKIAKAKLREEYPELSEEDLDIKLSEEARLLEEQRRQNQNYVHRPIVQQFVPPQHQAALVNQQAQAAYEAQRRQQQDGLLMARNVAIGQAPVPMMQDRAQLAAAAGPPGVVIAPGLPIPPGAAIPQGIYRGIHGGFPIFPAIPRGNQAQPNNDRNI